MSEQMVRVGVENNENIKFGVREIYRECENCSKPIDIQVDLQNGPDHGTLIREGYVWQTTIALSYDCSCGFGLTEYKNIGF